jgi:hypothetical protein
MMLFDSIGLQTSILPLPSFLLSFFFFLFTSIVFLFLRRKDTFSNKKLNDCLPNFVSFDLGLKRPGTEEVGLVTPQRPMPPRSTTKPAFSSIIYSPSSTIRVALGKDDPWWPSF